MDDRAREELKLRIQRCFPQAPAGPTLSLRGGNALDDYATPPPYDATLDAPTDDYIEAFHWGIHHLDPDSWLYYLPILLTYSLSQMEDGTSEAVDTFLFSLLPPDRDPPRFSTLTPPQVAAVVSVLEALGFSPNSRYQDDALQALQEYWGDVEPGGDHGSTPHR